jgi:hypothetical protein
MSSFSFYLFFFFFYKIGEQEDETGPAKWDGEQSRRAGLAPVGWGGDRERGYKGKNMCTYVYKCKK